MALNIVIMAAGRGTRMKSERPKVLHRLAGAPLLAHALQAAKGAGFDRLAVVVGPGMEDVGATANALDPTLDVFVQADQLGTADAVRAARRAFEDFPGQVLILYGDTPLLRAETIGKVRAALEAGASQIFVVGTSAGAFAAPFYGSLFAERFPRARIVALGDAAGLQQFKGSPIESGNWGLPQAVRRQDGWKNFPAQWGVPDLYITAAHAAPQLRLFQIDHAWDQNQGAWIARLGKPAHDLPGSLRSNRVEIMEQVDTFRSFTLWGLFHTVTTSSAFYSHHTDGRRIRDWVAGIESGASPASVDCTTCWRSGLRFTAADLRYVDAAIALLPSPSAWSPQDTTRCAADGPYSLRCALQRAGRTAPPTDAGSEAGDGGGQSNPVSVASNSSPILTMSPGTCCRSAVPRCM